MEKIRFIFSFFFELLLKFSDFVNFDNCIGKITSKYLKLNPVFVEKEILIR